MSNPAANTNNNRYAIAHGSKYEKGLDVKDIAARVRAEIKLDVKVGNLPKATYSVTISRFAGGRSLTVKITDVSFVIVNADRVRQDTLRPHGSHEAIAPRFNDRARDLLKRVEEIVGAYNFDGSDHQSDYFHVNFYQHIEFGWEQERDQTAELAKPFIAQRDEANRVAREALASPTSSSKGWVL